MGGNQKVEYESGYNCVRKTFEDLKPFIVQIVRDQNGEKKTSAIEFSGLKARQISVLDAAINYPEINVVGIGNRDIAKQIHETIIRDNLSVPLEDKKTLIEELLHKVKE